MGNKITVFTLNARDNVMLDVVKESFGLSDGVMHDEIGLLLSETQAALANKGLSYSNLRSALVPSQNRHEVGLVFDSLQIEEGWYGLPIHTALLPLYHRESSHSILTGDLIGEEKHQGHLYRALTRKLVPANSFTFHHSTQFYVVYVNYLKRTMVEKIHMGLRQFRPYVGMFDLTYSSALKSYLSFVLTNSCVKSGRTFIMGHEDDADPDRDYNMNGWPYEEFGYRYRSIPSMMFDQFLSYKIERPVLPGFKSDTTFSLNAVMPEPDDIASFDIDVPSPKFAYLCGNKTKSLEGIGALDKDAPYLAHLIQDRVSQNYIYNLEYDEEYELVKFNVMLEVISRDAHGPFRVVVSLKYVPSERVLRLITLY